MNGHRCSELQDRKGAVKKRGLTGKCDIGRYVRILGVAVTNEDSAKQFSICHGRPFLKMRWIGKVLNKEEYSVYCIMSKGKVGGRAQRMT